MLLWLGNPHAKARKQPPQRNYKDYPPFKTSCTAHRTSISGHFSLHQYPLAENRNLFIILPVAAFTTTTNICCPSGTLFAATVTNYI
ncbi:hypothetical protein [Chitinophaga sp. YR573]|uniref:hypothetical protein n=1 Tax=Chitinophaga sp. YR573 TaxID=1881040 RepID=UPI00115FD57F|nr:hypothetical protein [Chitinophaga sp. YR573]